MGYKCFVPGLKTGYTSDIKKKKKRRENKIELVPCFTGSMPIVLYQIPASPPCRAVQMAAEHLGLDLNLKLVDLFQGEHLKPEFLAIPASPPCRAVQMAAEHLGLDLTLKLVDLFQGEHLKPEFLAINPQHCVPTLDDNGFILWESRAILPYLVNRYAPDSPLYPQDPKARAHVDRVLHFDIGNLFKAMQDFYRPQLFQGLPADPEKAEALKKSLQLLESLLERTAYCAADHLTIADYSLLASLVFLEELLDYSYGDYPKISAWLQRLKKETPRYREINEVPLRQFKKILQSKK